MSIIDAHPVPPSPSPPRVVGRVHRHFAVPSGFNEKGNPTSITFIGKLYGEAEMLAVAKAYQDRTGWHLRYPPRFS